MTELWNVPTVQYCIEGRLPETGEVVSRFCIEQIEVGRVARSGEHPNYNTIQSHLSDLSKRTGLDYEIVRWGEPQDRRRWISGLPFGG